MNAGPVPGPTPHARRTVLLLSSAFALSATGQALTVAASPIVGALLAPRASLATLPISLQIVGMMAITLPASLLMGRFGRQAIFYIGLAIETVGALLATAAILRDDFVLFCAGSLGLGFLNGVSQFYRFAAADVAPDWRAKAISWVLAGGVAAGILGPAIAAQTADAFVPRFAGSYAAILALYAVVALVISRVKLPPRGDPNLEGIARPLRSIMAQPRFIAAVFGAMVAYGTMSLLMTSTPLSMQHAGHSFDSSAFVIQAHVVAMFAPSFFTGNLIARYGARRIMGAGIGLFAAVLLVGSAGQTVAHFAVALAALGLGWNLLFVGATTMLTGIHTPAERPKVQGVNDLLVFGTAAAGSLLAGALSARLGWYDLMLVVIPILVVAALVLGICFTLDRRLSAGTAPSPV